ncbi:MAG: CotH kinase family protein [Candidatus Zixiibacteriota bacterium]
MSFLKSVVQNRRKSSFPAACLYALMLLCLNIGTTAFGQNFYDVNTIRRIDLVFSQPNWDQILDSLYAAGLEERLLGTAIIDGVTFDSVGVRYKGQSTYSPTRIKNPFNIKLDHIIDNQVIYGYGTLKLSNVWYDPTFVREVIGYEIARKYMPASLANYTDVYVNGVAIGLYVSVQDVDKLFMRTHFHSDENARFKGEITGPSQVHVVWGYRGPDSADYQVLYELDSDAGWSDLIGFLDTLNNFTASVDQVLNIDRHLWMLAYDNHLVNLDAPINFAHNYYLYRDDANRFNPIIWDLNMIFGAFHKVIGGGNLTLTQMQQLSPFFNETNPNYPIVGKILSNPTYKKQYIAHLKTVIAENFANNWYLTRALELQDIVDSRVQADANKYAAYSGFLDNINSSYATIPGITELMSPRITYLNNHPQLRLSAPIISTVTHSPQVVDALGDITFVATVSNATVVNLAHRSNKIDKFAKVAMFDDGNHSDGAAADGVFGVTIPAASTNLHYYVYAENPNAATFLPPRAEFEDSVVAVISTNSSVLVINEFMADNVSTVTDQNGEYEDWVEIYNPTENAVALEGHHLSDKIDNPGKWTFPDTTIAAFDHMVIWADEDGAQPGLHAGFKLSSSGEAVVLSGPDMVIIDQYIYGAQDPDISMGRCPDGSGAFVSQTPTVGLANSCLSAGCGDNDGNGIVTIGDAVFSINYLFAGGPAPDPISTADADCSGIFTITDIVYLMNFIFADGPVPCEQCLLAN